MITRFIAVVLGSVLIFALSACQRSVQRLDKLDGLTEAQVLAELGAYARRDEYPMSKAAGEFRVGLRRYHPMPESADVRIREFTWEHWRYFVTAWLHQTNGQWIVFDSLRYGKEVQF